MQPKLLIRTKLVLAICVPLLAVYTAILVVEYRMGRERAIEQMKAHLTELAARRATERDEELSTISQVARCTADFLRNSPKLETAQIEQLLRSTLLDNPRIFGSCVALESGAMGPDAPAYAPYVCRTSAGDGIRQVDIARTVRDYARFDWYLLPKLLNRPTWTDPYFDDGAGNILMCTYSVPLQRDGKFAGVVTVDLSLDHLRKELNRIDLANGSCVLVSRTGTFVSHPNSELIMAETIFGLAEAYNVPELAEVGYQMTATIPRSGVARIHDYQTGAWKWIVYAPVRSAGWSLAALISEDAVMKDVYERLHRQSAFLMAGLSLMLLCVLVVAAWITRPLERLADAAKLVAGGDLSTQVTGIRSRDEIGQFATTFNQMVRDLKQNVEATIRETAARQAMEKELQVARQIQTSLLPSQRPPFPERHEFSLAAENEPARYMAGDFFDFWFLDQDVLALVIADVVGKGVPAAMFMAVSRTAIRNFSTAGRGPGETLALANRALAAENREQMFVTVFYAHYHTRTGQLVFANGGHNPPYLVRSTGQIDGLGTSTGPIVGVFEDATYDECQATLGPGDLLVLYTDGVTEAQDEAGQLLGDEGFRRILEQVHSQPVDVLCQSIIRQVDRYRNHEAQDDVTLLALKRTLLHSDDQNR